jgi:hypothetical protein
MGIITKKKKNGKTSVFYFLLDLAFKNSLGFYWQPFHRFVSWVYRKYAIRLVSRALNSTIKEETQVKVIARQSASTAVDFNAFASDLDVGVLLSEEVREETYSAMRLKLSNLNRRFKVLGEAEFYLESEWARRVFLESSNPEWLTAIRDLRKLTWMEQALETASTEYHKRKSLRSIRRIYSRLGRPELPPLSSGNQARVSLEIENLVRRQFSDQDLTKVNDLLPIGSIVAWTHFFATSVVSHDLDPKYRDSNFIVLEKTMAASLLATIPSYGWTTDSEISNLTTRLRANIPALAEKFRVTVEWENLQFTAFMRSVEKKQPWMTEVKSSLDQDTASAR